MGQNMRPPLGLKITGTRKSPDWGRGLTLAQKHVLRQVPEGRLHHVKVPAAHAVHEGGQEVGRQAAAEAERGDMMTPEEG